MPRGKRKFPLNDEELTRMFELQDSRINAEGYGVGMSYAGKRKDLTLRRAILKEMDKRRLIPESERTPEFLINLYGRL